MTLNKQKILSELGSVVNQLQSADCGCMGKLFGNSDQYNSPMASPYSQHGGCSHSCCHGCGHGYNAAARGEPYSTNNQQASCMGHCNPPKLYADTYNFLNEKLMQPVVKEVYHDLSIINPTNTIMNNDMARKLGFGQTQQATPPAQNQARPMSHSPANGLDPFKPSNQMQNQFSASNQMHNQQMMQNTQMMPNPQMPGGMGPQIMSMINGDSIVSSSQPRQDRPITEPMIIDAPQSPHGKVAVTPLAAPMTTNNVFNANNPSQLQSSMPDGNSLPAAQYQNPMQQQLMPQQTNQQMPQQMSQQMPQQMPQQTQNYGQHSQGMKKFNEMFPGVMQGLGGDLGFDPMSIAIQMNPANHQQAAINKMHSILNNERPAAPIQNTYMQQNAVPNQLQPVPPNQTYNQNLVPQLSNQQNIAQDQFANQALVHQQQQQQQEQQQFQQQPTTQIPVQSQQVYQVSPNPQMSQQPIPAQSGAIQMADPNIEAPMAQSNLATVQENKVLSQPGSQPLSQALMKDPIFPVDTTKQKIYHNLNNKRRYYNQEPAYNTLGQPVEKVPRSMYQTHVPPLPQTLYPEPIQNNNQAKYATVKATISKTSLMGNKPVGPTPSRNQLQHIYNQYKGSQSFTQQNVKPPAEGASHSDRKLNVPVERKIANGIPVERTAGDTYANSQLNEPKVNPEHIIGQIGDVPQPEIMKTEKDMSSNIRKSRNGLQDLVYTSYPTSAAWTFHGDNYRSQLAARRYSRYRY